MAQETRVEEARCTLQTFERNRYFYGKPMTVSDFEAEQRYLIGKHRYINRLVHGAGVLCGLQVALPDGFSAERPTVELTEGAALDCCGNLIVVSRGGTSEIKGEFNANGLNYLYIKYTECAKQPVMSASNVASCEEVCCYNRIQETFEIVASQTPPSGGPAENGGGVQPTNGGVTPAPAVLVPASGVSTPDGATACRDLAEQYFQEHLRNSPACEDPQVFLAVLDMDKGALDEAKTAEYRAIVYTNPMLEALMCGHVTNFENPHRTTAAQIFALQSVNRVGNSGNRSFVSNIDLVSTDNTIGIVPDVNASVIDLLLALNAVRTSHLHEDVIQNLLRSSKTVVVEPDVAGKKISLRTNPAKKVTSVGAARVVGTSSNYSPEDHAHDLADGVVGKRHLAEDIYNTLLQGTGIIKVSPDASGRTINLSADTAPADDPKMVTSVGPTKGVGRSAKFAREDHAHDLAEGVVERRHLAEEVYGNLVQGVGLISVKPDAAGRTIRIGTDIAPAEDPKMVRSVGGTKLVGKSGRFAREDHAHDLRINGRSPGETGDFVLSPGANVRIENGAGGNELVISASAPSPVVNSTGLFIFERVLPQELHMSPLIPHRLEAEAVAVILAEEDLLGIRSLERALSLTPLSFVAHFGDVRAFAPENPSLMATLNYSLRSIQIRLKDNRQRSEITFERTYRVRWWAVPAVETFTSPVLKPE